MSLNTWHEVLKEKEEGGGGPGGGGVARDSRAKMVAAWAGLESGIDASDSGIESSDSGVSSNGRDSDSESARVTPVC